MKRKILGRIGLFIFTFICGITIFSNVSYAQEVDGFNIIPKIEDTSTINSSIQIIGSKGGEVRNRYNESAEGMKTDAQIASGIMDRNTILNYLVFVVQFLSQLGLVVGAGFIMYAGYKYMVSVFNGGKLPSETIKNAIIGVIIVIFSYAIMKTLTSFIGIS